MYLNKNIELERERIYCHHDITHLLDVCRIAYILVLEKNININKEIIYACGLLHDIGRWKEYTKGIDHALASKELAIEILKDCSFNEKEITLISDAIANHRNKNNHNSPLSELIYKSDKLSRPCFHCNAKSKCKRFLNGETAILKY